MLTNATLDIHVTPNQARAKAGDILRQHQYVSGVQISWRTADLCGIYLLQQEVYEFLNIPCSGEYLYPRSSFVVVIIPVCLFFHSSLALFQATLRPWHALPITVWPIVWPSFLLTCLLPPPLTTCIPGPVDTTAVRLTIHLVSKRKQTTA